MKVNQLIAYLQEMPQDLDVFAYCDHGQTREYPSRPSVRYITIENDDVDNIGYEDIEDLEDDYGEDEDAVSFVLL